MPNWMPDWAPALAIFLALGFLFNISRKMDEAVDLLRKISKTQRDP